MLTFDKESKPRIDLHSSPKKQPPGQDAQKFLTPPRKEASSADDAAKQCWTVSFGGSEAARPVVFSRQRLPRELKPLIPGMVDQLSLDLERLKQLIENYQKTETQKSDRSKLDKRKRRLTGEVSTIFNQIIFVLDPDYLNQIFPNNDDLKFIIRCLNNNTSFVQRLKIIARLGLRRADENIHWAEIKDYEQIREQLVFEQKLIRLNITFVPLSMIKPKSEKRTRVVLTDVVRSTLGFEYMLTWVEKFTEQYFEDAEAKVSLKKAGPKKIAEDLSNIGITCADFEIAWGHLMNDGRHTDEDIVFVSNVDALRYALNICSPDSTFVLDGHGGTNQLSIGLLRLQGVDLRKYIKNIVGMIGANISHVILSVCATGHLTVKESIMDENKSPRKNKYEFNDADVTAIHKNRKKVFIEDSSSFEMVAAMFEKLSLDNRSETLASYFAALLLSRKSQSTEYGTAFTFSPSLLFPDSINGGVMCAPASSTDRRCWPDYHESWSRDEREKNLLQIMFKSVTLYNNPANRKAIAEDGAWKKLPGAKMRL